MVRNVRIASSLQDLSIQARRTAPSTDLAYIWDFEIRQRISDRHVLCDANWRILASRDQFAQGSDFFLRFGWINEPVCLEVPFYKSLDRGGQRR